MRCFKCFYILFAMALLPRPTMAQAALEDTTSAAFKTVTAGDYQRSNFHQWLWGRNRRAEWSTPIQVPVLWLDTACGGLTPYQHGGGNETRSLRLKSASGKEYS